MHASLEVMEVRYARVREGRPYVFTDLLRRDNLDHIIAFIEKWADWLRPRQRVDTPAGEV